MPVTESFLETTIKDISKSGHTPEDIVFIGSKNTNHSCTWEEFKELCKQQEQNLNICYDAPYDLIIIFKDGLMMDRYNIEYGNEDFWRYQKPFTVPTEKIPMTKLFGNHTSLEDVHREPSEDEIDIEDEEE